MKKKAVAISHKMKGVLDDNYTLYEDGTVVHFYDKHSYPGGQNLEKTLKVSDLSNEVKQRLWEAANEENKELVSKLLQLK